MLQVAAAEDPRDPEPLLQGRRVEGEVAWTLVLTCERPAEVWSPRLEVPGLCAAGVGTGERAGALRP